MPDDIIERILQCCHVDLLVYHVKCLLEILCLTFYAGLSGVHSASSVCSRSSLVAYVLFEFQVVSFVGRGARLWRHPG